MIKIKLPSWEACLDNKDSGNVVHSILYHNESSDEYNSNKLREDLKGLIELCLNNPEEVRIMLEGEFVND